MKSKFEYLLKHNRVIHFLYIHLFSLFFKFVGLFVRTDKTMILFSGHGKRFNDSPKAIYLTLLQRGLDNKYRCVWAVDNSSKYDIPGKHETVVIDSWKYFICALKAKYWCCCVNIERGLHFKKNKTIFLNTWHCVPTNYMGNRAGRKDFDWRNTNFICYSGEFERPIIIEDCVAKPSSLIPIGLPRNDILWHCDLNLKKKMREKLGITEDKKVILYAPTWRDSQNDGKSFDLTPPIDWKLWENSLSNDYVVLLRTHAYTNKLNGVSFGKFIIDCCEYPEVNDLMIAADVLISDYSSIIFDFAILERPIICYGYDYDTYIQKRGFYFDLEKEFYGGIVKDQKDVLKRILSLNFEIESEATKKMKNRFVLYGGDASNLCVKYLLGE